MAESNQRSIKSFFEGSKRPRTQESRVSDNEVETRQSKSARISLPTSTNSESDLDDIYEISRESASLAITTIEDKRSNTVRLFPWKDKYLNMFSWLRYDAFTGKATCSYRACNMYFLL